MKKVDVAKKRKPKIIVFSDERYPLSVHEVWVYPYSKMRSGARLLFMLAHQGDQDETLRIWVYLEKEFEKDPDETELSGDEQHRRFIDGLCDMSLTALAKQGIKLPDPVDVHIGMGALTYADFD